MLPAVGAGVLAEPDLPLVHRPERHVAAEASLVGDGGAARVDELVLADGRRRPGQRAIGGTVEDPGGCGGGHHLARCLVRCRRCAGQRDQDEGDHGCCAPEHGPCRGDGPYGRGPALLAVDRTGDPRRQAVAVVGREGDGGGSRVAATQLVDDVVGHGRPPRGDRSAVSWSVGSWVGRELTQTGASTREARAHRAHRDAQRLGGRGIAQPRPHAQGEDLGLGPPQRADRAGGPRQRLGVVEALHRLVREVGHDRLAGPAAPGTTPAAAGRGGRSSPGGS